MDQATRNALKRIQAELNRSRETYGPVENWINVSVSQARRYVHDSACHCRAIVHREVDTNESGYDRFPEIQQTSEDDGILFGFVWKSLQGEYKLFDASIILRRWSSRNQNIPETSDEAMLAYGRWSDIAENVALALESYRPQISQALPSPHPLPERALASICPGKHARGNSDWTLLLLHHIGWHTTKSLLRAEHTVEIPGVLPRLNHPFEMGDHESQLRGFGYGEIIDEGLLNEFFTSRLKLDLYDSLIIAIELLPELIEAGAANAQGNEALPAAESTGVTLATIETSAGIAGGNSVPEFVLTADKVVRVSHNGADVELTRDNPVELLVRLAKANGSTYVTKDRSNKSRLVKDYLIPNGLNKLASAIKSVRGTGYRIDPSIARATIRQD